MTKNLKAFLDTIAFSEIGAKLLSKSDDGYNVIVGSTAEHPVLMTTYADHPRKIMDLEIEHKDGTITRLKSTAAGRYQILKRYFDFYKSMLKLKDFGKDAQDAIAIQMIKECKAVQDIEAGNFTAAVDKCRSRWASLPNAGYDQHENELAPLLAAYVKAGGMLA